MINPEFPTTGPPQSYYPYGRAERRVARFSDVIGVREAAEDNAADIAAERAARLVCRLRELEITDESESGFSS